MEALPKEPLLPLATKHRGMIGESRVRATVQAQLRARGLRTPPENVDRAKKMPFPVFNARGLRGGCRDMGIARRQ